MLNQSESQLSHNSISPIRRFSSVVDIAKREEAFQQIGAFSKEPGPAEITLAFQTRAQEADLETVLEALSKISSCCKYSREKETSP